MGNIRMNKTAKRNTAEKPPGSPPKARKSKTGGGIPEGGRGAPRGNANAMKHGLRSTRLGLRHGFAGSKLPREVRYVENKVNALRRQVEDAVLALRGEISLPDAAMINSVLKWERHGRLAAHWLRTQGEELSPADKLRFSEAIAKASDNRDKALKQLQLDKQQTAIDVLYSREESSDD